MDLPLILAVIGALVSLMTAGCTVFGVVIAGLGFFWRIGALARIMVTREDLNAATTKIHNRIDKRETDSEAGDQGIRTEMHSLRDDVCGRLNNLSADVALIKGSLEKRS